MADINEDSIQRFVLETNCSEETARFYLEMCNGAFAQALENYHSSEVRADRRFTSRGQQGPQLNEHPHQEVNAQQQEGDRLGLLHGVFRILNGLVLLPLHVLKTSFYVCRVVIRHSLTATAHVLLPSAVQNRYMQTNGTADPVLQAADFIRAFERQFGSQHPNFVELGWKEAAREAENQSKFLFAYIHAPQHQDTEAFSQSVLASSEIIAFLNQHFVCWGGSIDRSPAFILAQNLGATTFPFMCLLSYTGSQATVVTSIQGKITGSNLLITLQQALNEQGAMMQERRAEISQRERDREIRRDQDLEYQRALEVDRERDRVNQEAAAAAAATEEANRRRLEAERLAKEREAQEKSNKEERIRERKISKKMQLGAEPELGPGVTQIRVRLPDGSTHNRRFVDSSKVEEVYDFVAGLESLNCWDYTLVSSFPRLVFSFETRVQSLRDLGIGHSAMLLVQSNDD